MSLPCPGRNSGGRKDGNKRKKIRLLHHRNFGYTEQISHIGGGFNFILCSSLPGEMIQFD